MRLGHCLLALLAISAVGVASANTAPFADAGLDQHVETGTTVYLDATGSRDADGQITAYRWQIETPNGSTVAPDCLSCERTSFAPRQNGTYDVTVTVTDDDGARRSDTLYVTARRMSPPTLSLTGPAQLVIDSSGTYELSADAGDAPLSMLTWYVDGSRHRQASLDGESATRTLDLSFPDPGSHTVSVHVTDRDGRQQTAERSITVRSTTGSAVLGGLPGSVGGSDFLQYDDFENPSTVTITDEDADGIEFLTDNKGAQDWITDSGLSVLMENGGNKRTTEDGTVVYEFTGNSVDMITDSVDRYDGIGSTWRLDNQIDGDSTNDIDDQTTDTGDSGAGSENPLNGPPETDTNSIDEEDDRSLDNKSGGQNANNPEEDVDGENTDGWLNDSSSTDGDDDNDESGGQDNSPTKDDNNESIGGVVSSFLDGFLS